MSTDPQTIIAVVLALFTIIGGIGGAIKYIQTLIKSENEAFTRLIKEVQDNMKAIEVRIQELPNKFISKDDHRADIQDLRSDLRDLRLDNTSNFASISTRLDQLLQNNQRGKLV